MDLIWGWHWDLLVIALVALAVTQTARPRAMAPINASRNAVLNAEIGPDSVLGGGPGPGAGAGAGDDAAPAPHMTEQKYCSGCGALIHKSAVQCPKCGAPQVAVAYGQKSRLAAILFAVLLGWIGVHKFYLGRVGQGLLYLLFFWTGIPALIGLIEGIIYLTMTDQAFAAKYG